MADTPADHNKVIAAAARSALKPLGMRQKGRSRVWLDDHGWWLIAVEFQASSWSAGSYLNVGWMHLWSALDHVAFEGPDQAEVRVRLDGDQQFASSRDGTFSSDVERMASAAAVRVEDLRARHGHGRDALTRLAAVRSKNLFDLVNAGIAGVLVGDAAAADSLQRVVQRAEDSPFHWTRETGAAAEKALELRADKEELVSWLGTRISLTRAALKLAPLDRAELVAAWELA